MKNPCIVQRDRHEALVPPNRDLLSIPATIASPREAPKKPCPRNSGFEGKFWPNLSPNCGFEASDEATLVRNIADLRLSKTKFLRF
ncbi:hypothetical protein E4T56_gene1147 [Termitomyces sp. T112]|nr:hypothetical protein E4T56_gene1147 [Termitomyces sp. T112]